MALIMRPIPNLRHTFVERFPTAMTWAGAAAGDSLLTQIVYMGRVQPKRMDNDSTGNTEYTILLEKLREICGD